MRTWGLAGEGRWWALAYSELEQANELIMN